jgi:hypothetical protein
MKKDVHNFVKSCLSCHLAKPDRTKSPRLLQPLPLPSGAWQTITLDFVKELPLSGKAGYIGGGG